MTQLFAELKAQMDQEMELVMLIYFPLVLILWIIYQLLQEYVQLQHQEKVLKRKHKHLKNLKVKSGSSHRYTEV